MIAKTDLLRHIRRLLADEDTRTYSDYQLTCALDDALDYLSAQCALLSADLTRTTVELSRGDALPDDLISLITLTGEHGDVLTCTHSATERGAPHTYRIEDGILTHPKRARLTYHRTLPHIDDADELDLPATLLGTLARLSALTARGADDDAKEIALKRDRTLIARRNRTRRQVYQPWRV